MYAVMQSVMKSKKWYLFSYSFIDGYPYYFLDWSHSLFNIEDMSRYFLLIQFTNRHFSFLWEFIDLSVRCYHIHVPLFFVAYYIYETVFFSFITWMNLHFELVLESWNVFFRVSKYMNRHLLTLFLLRIRSLPVFWIDELTFVSVLNISVFLFRR